MDKHIFVCFVFVPFFVAITAVASATATEDAELAAIQNPIKIEFNTSDLSFRTFENYDIVELKGCQLKKNVGEPALPMRSISLVMPPAAKITDIVVLSSESIEIEGEYTILPALPPVPTSTLTYQNNTWEVAQKESVYSSPDMYPGDIFRYTGEGNLRGYKIVSLTLFPVQYAPADKKLMLYTDITLCINYTKAPEMLTKGITTPSGSSRFIPIVKKTVLNPNDIGTYNNLVQSTSSYSDDVKYVIITNDMMKDAFQPLTDWKTKKGVPAKIVTVTSIEANYTGKDTQNKIRNFIKDACMNWSTEWILLGGDTDVVPFRGAYSIVSSSGEYSSTAAPTSGYWVDYNIPADLYYSALDGNWDSNGNSVYGEVDDVVDMYPDVFVGRVPVNTIVEAQTFVEKTLIYEKNPPMDYELDILFLAESLWSNPPTWGADMKNIIDNYDIPPKYDPITKKYELYGNASREIAISEMNSGSHIVNHVGHGNTGFFCVGNGCVQSSDADNLTNSPKNFILYTIACYSNAFDYDSISKHFMNNPDGGTVAYIGNSRYGFFIPGEPSNGPSNLYDQEFFKALFADNFYHLGKTVAYSKVKYIGVSQEDGTGMRWLQYAINLLGDPELPIWTEIPQTFTINKPSEIAVDISQEISIQVLNGTEPVQNATVCIMKNDDAIYNVSATDSSGNVSFMVSPSAGMLNITVTKQNFIPDESAILVITASAPVISSSTHPDEDTWYCTRNVTFTWAILPDASGIACYSYILDSLSATTPDKICDTTENTTSYTDLAFGIRYFHVRAKNNANTWGPAGHYRVQIEDCDLKDGCYVYGTGCEDRDYYCDGSVCKYTYSNRHTDYYGGWVNYCKGDEVWKHRLFHDFYCEGCSCKDRTSWKDEQMVKNCNVNDGWYDTGDTRWVDDPANECKEKEQKKQEYRDYTCSGGACTYSVTNTQWIDTGNVRNKPDGTDCGSDYYDNGVNYCKGDEVWKHRLFHDFYCEGGSCTDHTSWKDDQMVKNCNVNDGWYDTGDTKWVDDPANECKEKEQKKQEYRDYTCSGGACTYSVTNTQWIDTGNRRNKPNGTICGCTVNNTLKSCYDGSCSDTGICKASICNADVSCDGKKLGEDCGIDSKCNYICKCVRTVLFDTGVPANPYPSISGRHSGTIKLDETITVSKLYTYPCPSTGGHTEYARIWNNSGLDVTARWEGYTGDWHNITFNNEPFVLYKNKTYNYSLHTGSYPCIIHAKSKHAIGGVGIINCTHFIDTNGKVYIDWIPAIRLWA